MHGVIAISTPTGSVHICPRGTLSAVGAVCPVRRGLSVGSTRGGIRGEGSATGWGRSTPIERRGGDRGLCTRIRANVKDLSRLASRDLSSLLWWRLPLLVLLLLLLPWRGLLRIAVSLWPSTASRLIVFQIAQGPKRVPFGMEPRLEGRDVDVIASLRRRS